LADPSASADAAEHLNGIGGDFHDGVGGDQLRDGRVP
jgi:hypothetical protein